MPAAVKIAPQYDHTVVHVNDASRAVTVVGNLLQPQTKSDYKAKIKEEYDDFRARFQQRNDHKTYVSLAEARAQKHKIDFEAQPPVRPNQLGIQHFDQELEALVDYIDWTPFFRSWDLHGKYPDILTDDIVGTEATQLFDDAKAMLQQIIDGKLLQAKAVFGLFEANSNDQDDIEAMAMQAISERGLKIEVKSHMSSLEDSAVRKVRQHLFGKKNQKTDVKIKPSVIRRRRQPASI